jgi:hypothetical protein
LALSFMAVGVVMAFIMGGELNTWHNAQNWPEVPARILHAEVKRHSHEKRKNRGATYTVAARYAYEHNGRQYVGQKIDLSSSSDSVKAYHQNVCDELRQHQESGQPFRCYVNPDKPEQALLYRDLRWEKLAFYLTFVLAFGGVGFGMMIGTLNKIPKSLASAALYRRNPGTPWLWRPEWAAGQIVYSSKKMMFAAVTLAVFCNVGSLPLWLVMPDEILRKGGGGTALVMLLFPAVGLGLIVWAVCEIRHWRKYGPSILKMESVPGVIGERLAGVILTSAKVRPTDGFHLNFVCTHYLATGSGKRRHVSTHILHQEEQVVHELLDDVNEMSAIPVVFQIPDGCRCTDDVNDDDLVCWELHVWAKEPGFNYRATFEVPVFGREEEGGSSEVQIMR